MNLVFDIGANIGETTTFFASCAKKVVAIEPNPELFNKLRYKFEKKNVTLDSRGISDSIGTKKFYISNLHTLSTFSLDWVQSSRFAQSFDWGLELDIETTTLNDLIEEYGIPDYIKIDIEGHEFEVLTSFNKLLQNTIIAFEWVEEQHCKLLKILDHLYSLGYKNFCMAYNDQILLEKQISWKPYDKVFFDADFNPKRKEKWGMVYVKM